MEQQQIKTQKVSRETIDLVDDLVSNHRKELEDYLEQLLWWNQRINLVSRSVSRETVWEHIRHSLLLSHFDVFKQNELVVDAGTGGGLPGIPLAICHPHKHFVLNDLVNKKCLAMKQMVKKLGLENIGIVDGPIESFTHDEPFLLISKHAFKISDLLEMTETLPWQQMVFYKGVDFKDELIDLSKSMAIESYDLSELSDFYQGKAIIILSQ